MKGIIIYSTKTKVTEKCVGIIKDSLPDFEVVDLCDKKAVKNTDFLSYDYWIVGAPFRMNKLEKHTAKFVNKYGNYMLDKKYAIFGVGINTLSAESQLRNFYDNLLDEAVVYGWFNGELNIDDAKGFNKFFMQSIALSITSQGKPLPKIDKEIINEFIERIKGNLNGETFENNCLISKCYSENDEKDDSDEEFKEDIINNDTYNNENEEVDFKENEK